MLACCHHRVLSTGVFLAATLFLRFPLFYALYFFICPVCTPLISRFIPCPPLVHLAVEADNAFCDCCVSVPGHLARCLETIRVIKAGLQCAKAITRQRTLPQQFPPPLSTTTMRRLSTSVSFPRCCRERFNTWHNRELPL